MKILDLLINGKKKLSEYSSTSDLDIEAILSSLLDVKRSNLFFMKNEDIKDINIIKQFWKCVDQRKCGKPISKIFNKKYFWKSEFFVNENVLDPRGDSEILIELVLDEYKNELNKNYRIFDLGTGSGCLVLSLLQEFKNATAVAIDISNLALDVAKQNSKKLYLDSRVRFVNENWNDNIYEKFDIIISNPPYIRTDDINYLSNDVKNFDPLLALNGGEDGLKCYRYLAQNLKKNCYKNTKIFLEISFNQQQQVRYIFEKNNFVFIRCKKDLSYQDRVMEFTINH